MHASGRRDTVAALIVFCAGLAMSRPQAADPSPGRTPRFLEPLEEPSAVAVDGTGSIFVCEALGHRVAVFDRQGGFVRRWGRFGRGEGEFDQPRGIAAGAGGRVYVVDTGNDRIEVFDSYGRFERQWGRHGSDSGEFDEPMGVAVGRDGRVYVADAGNNRIQVFGSDGAFLFFVWSYGYHDGAFDRPVDVAVGVEGDFYVSDQGNSRIQKFAPDGRFVLTWGGRGRRGGLLVEPGGLDERGGRLVVADPYSRRLVTFDRFGALLGEWSASAGDESRGIDAPSSVAFLPGAEELVVCSAVEDRCQIVSQETDAAPAAEFGPRRIARDGYAVGGSGDAIVLASRETGVPFIVDLAATPPAIVASLGGPGREPGEFMRPTGFVFDRTRGTILVSDGGNARLQRLRLEGSRTTYTEGIGLDDQERLDVEPAGWSLDPATVGPGSIVRDTEGRIVIADTVGRRIVVLRDDFRLARTWGGFGNEDGRFRAPVGLALAPSGSTLYVLDAGRRRVQAFGLDGRLRFAWGAEGQGHGEFSAPSGIATSRDGSVYVVDRGLNRVQRFDGRGTWVAAWGNLGEGKGQFRKPEAVHVDGRGRVIVIDSGNRRAQAFAPDGLFLWDVSLDPAALAPARGRSSKAVRSPTSSPNCSRSAISNGGRYTVCVTSEPAPVPLNQPFALNVAIFADSRRRRLAERVILDVDATMPEHRHGMSLKPKVRAVDGAIVQDLLPGHGAIGNGRFEVEGMLFHMPGRWEIHFDISHGAITERAQIEVNLD
jgi:DNA-binding beta-propeller fold protein YncE